MNGKNGFPGDLGFDPLYKFSEEGAYEQQKLRLAEIKTFATAAAAVACAAPADFRAAAVLGAALAAALAAAASTVRSATADTVCGLPRETGVRRERPAAGATLVAAR